MGRFDIIFRISVKFRFENFGFAFFFPDPKFSDLRPNWQICDIGKTYLTESRYNFRVGKNALETMLET